MKKTELQQIIKEEMSLFKNNGRLTPFMTEDDFAKRWADNNSQALTEDKSSGKQVDEV